MEQDVQKPTGKLESLPKDELLKFIKRQAISSKDLKKKIADLEDALSKEKEEVLALELEKKEWISRGVSAEFEKKDKLVKKDRELELAARLAAEMLEENDELHGQLQIRMKDQEEMLLNKTQLVEALKQDKVELEASLEKLKGEYNTTVLESQDLRDKLQASQQDCVELKATYEENKHLKDTIKDLEYQLANPVKYIKLKDDFEELGKANKILKDDKMLAEQDRTAKSEQILSFDKEIKNLRQEMAEKNKVIKDKMKLQETMKATNVELSEALKAAQDKCEELQADIQKNQQEKEKYLKAIKSMKTKMERTALIEEELRKQLNAIVGERDEMIKKNLKRTQKQKKDSTDSAKKEELLGELKTQISALEAEKIDWSKKYTDLQTSHEATQKELQKLRLEMNALEVEEKEGHKEPFVEEVICDEVNVDENQEKAVGENTDLNAEMQQLKEELDTFKKGAPETKATIVKLESRIIDLLNQLQTLNEEKLNQESSLEELFKTHDDLSNQYDFECKERQKKEKEVAHLEQQLRALQEKEGKERSTCDLEQQIDLLEETINDMTVEKDHYRQELLVKEEFIQQLRTDIEDVRRKNTSKCSTATNEIERCTQEIDTLRTQLRSLSTELECSSKEAEETKLQLQNVLQEKEELNRSVDACEKNTSVLKSQFDAKVLECEELKQQMREHSTPNNSLVDIQDQQEEVRNLHNDLDYLEKQYKQVSKENIILKEEFQVMVETKTSYQNDLDEIKVKLDQYMKEKASLKNELSQFTEVAEKYGYDNVFDFDVYVSSLSSDVVTSTRMLQGLTMEKELLDSKCHELELKLKTSANDENNSVLKNEIELMKSEIAHADFKITERDTEIQEKNEIITLKLEEIGKLQENIQLYQGWEDKRPAQGENQEQLKTEIEEYNHQVGCLNQTIETLQNELNELKLIKEKDSSEIEEKDLLIGDLRSQLFKVQESTTTKSEDQEKPGSLEAEIIQEKLAEKEELVLQLSQDLRGSQMFGDNLKADLEDNDVKIKELEMKCEQAQESYKHLQDINTCLEENYSSLQSAHACALGEKKKVVEELNQVNVINENLENKLQTALEKMVTLQNELKEKEESVDKLQTALSEKEHTINELNSLLEEKGNKGSKFKNAAVKARKELETLKEKYETETTSLERQITDVKDEFNCVATELTRQKTECSKHEEEFEEFQSEIKNLQNEIEKERECLRGVEEALREKEEEALKLKEQVQDQQMELETLKPALEDLQKHLDGALEERQQHLVKSLEIGDYEKTVDRMQNSLNEKDRHIAEVQTALDRMTEMQRSMEVELGGIKKENSDFETKNEKLKTTMAKLKKELSEKQQEQQKTQEEIQVFEKTIEDFQRNVEAMKIEASQLNAEKIDLQNELKNCAELHEKQYKTLEVKLARSANDLLAAQRENTTLSQEFEQYKVRAHNVLKQQKSKQQVEEEKEENQHHLEEVIEDLKQKLCVSSGDLGKLEGSYNELQQEYDGLQARHHEFIEEIGEKEFAWKQKVTQVKLEASTKVLEYQDKLQVIQSENDNLIREAQERQEEAGVRTQQLQTEDKERYEKEIERMCEEMALLRDELALLKRKRQENPPSVLDLAQKHSSSYDFQDSLDSRGNDSLEFKSVSERQEGEGMDSRELEIIDTLSQRGSHPHTPTSPSHASILDKLLSPVKVPALASPQSPTALAQELTFAKSSLQTAVKKNEHMTALIRESEANACRLADQANILKEEIRRLERNEEREQALNNMEYLKNVIIKFLKVGSIEKEQLIPVLSTMLKLNEEEKKFIFEFAKGGDAEENEDAGSWSSYVYRWTSMS